MSFAVKITFALTLSTMFFFSEGDRVIEENVSSLICRTTRILTRYCYHDSFNHIFSSWHQHQRYLVCFFHHNELSLASTLLVSLVTCSSLSRISGCL